ncbi:hypothetical protein ANO11243_014100 [Dothideomycetidae sp. 11243]|nr:hypothetical protein ANO11243_014100 [fungal sp. No.11243]
MGGYVFDFDQSFGSTTPAFATGIKRLSITPKGVKFLADCGVLPVITRKEIIDKSKIDELGKFVTVLQVSWMLMQVFLRLVLHLPISLLEVTVLGHVFCACVLTALWWHKPRKIEEPTILKGDWARPLATLMLMVSQLDSPESWMTPGFRMNKAQLAEIASLEVSLCSVDGSFQMKEREIEHSSVSTLCSAGLNRVTPVDALQADGRESHAGENEHTYRSALTRTRQRLACEALQEYAAARKLLRRPVSPRNQKYANALESYPEMPERCRRCRRSDLEQALSYDDLPWYECRTERLVTLEANDWPHDGLLRTTGGLTMGTTLWAASVVFSAIHIAAWNSSFPSDIEAWLWRASALYVGFSGLLWAFLHVIADSSARVWWMWYDIMVGDASRLVVYPLVVLCSVCGASYVLARGYLIIEGYIELRSLLVGTFNTPQWTVAIPHVS